MFRSKYQSTIAIIHIGDRLTESSLVSAGGVLATSEMNLEGAFPETPYVQERPIASASFLGTPKAKDFQLTTSRDTPSYPR